MIYEKYMQLISMSEYDVQFGQLKKLQITNFSAHNRSKTPAKKREIRHQVWLFTQKYYF